MKIPNEEKELLRGYLDNAISGITEQLQELRSRIKFFTDQKSKMQSIRKFIKWAENLVLITKIRRKE